MAYAAVISLKQTIQHLLDSSHISIVSSCREMMESSYKELKHLQKVVVKFEEISRSNSTSVEMLNNVFDGKIREAACELEDALESCVSDQFLSHSERFGEWSYRFVLSLDLQQVKQDFDSFTQKVKKMIKELQEDNFIWSRIAFCGDKLLDDDDDTYDEDTVTLGTNYGWKSKMVGLSEEIEKILDLLIRPWSSELEIVSLVGMVGIGKTKLANNVFEDPSISHHFSCCAWVTIGQKYRLKEILLGIQAQVNPSSIDIGNMPYLNSAPHWHKSLQGKRYLIVLDDVWDTLVWERMKLLLPNDRNGSRVLVTTKMKEVALYADRSTVHQMRFLDKEEIWFLLCEKVFANEPCHPDLEKPGKKIAENCLGHPLLITGVAHILSNYEKTAECWNKVAEMGNLIFMDAYNLLSKIYKITEDQKSSTLFPDDDGDSLRIDSEGNKSKMVGLSKEVGKILGLLMRQSFELQIVSLVGMAGIGKTTLAKEVFEDTSILHHFPCRVWVTTGPKHHLREIMFSILAKVNPSIQIEWPWSGPKEVARHLEKCLSSRRYLIVLDDVWDVEFSSYLKRYLPDSRNGSRVLLTSRLHKVAYSVGRPLQIHKMRLLNKEESWCLFREKVFPSRSCPSQLVEIGKKIAEKCDGLPLAIVTVAGILSKATNTPKYWNEIATEKQHSVFIEAYDQMYEVLFPSYKYLHQHAKPCFLYMGVFPPNYEISSSRLIKLWSTEGFLEPNPSEIMEDYAVKCLQDLVLASLVIIHQQSSGHLTKTCSLHSVFWHLCNKEAKKIKFFRILNSYVDDSAEDIKNERRLSVQSSVLFKIVYNNSMTTSTTRSLLFTSPDHQYPVPISSTLRLLRVLDALAIRYYQFPNEVLKMMLLRYLVITFNGKVPVSISKLRNLQILIVCRHLSIKSFEDSSQLPIEIWRMQELKLLEITGCNLPDPCDASLSNLSTLMDVSPQSCTQKVFESIPNLTKLGIRIELALDDVVAPLSCFDHISLLHKLESLKCIIVNPELNLEMVTPPASLPIFPSSLKKLSLSGIGYPWETMREIASLPNLEVLKLRCYAFQGPKWETFHEEFLRLKYLLIEDTDLVHWEVAYGSFLALRHLSIKHCYKLEDLPVILRGRATIEVVDCNPLAVTLKEQIQVPIIHPQYSWEDVKRS